MKLWHLSGRADTESQRDSTTQPRVASLRATLGDRRRCGSTLKGLQPRACTLTFQVTQRCNPYRVVFPQGTASQGSSFLATLG